MRATKFRHDRPGGETKPCERKGCTLTVVRRDALKSAAKWARQRFCSVQCANLHKNPLIGRRRKAVNPAFNSFPGSLARAAR